MNHYFEDPNRYMLIFELCRGGELSNLVKFGKLGENEAGFILK
jgi:hypothetical protein